MSVHEDRQEFENSGLRGILRRLMAGADEGFVRILSEGWQGERVDSRPAPGSGPYIHFRRGFPLHKYLNEKSGDERVEEYHLPPRH
jgi:hypothetical protein